MVIYYNNDKEVKLVMNDGYNPIEIDNPSDCPHCRRKKTMHILRVDLDDLQVKAKDNFTYIGSMGPMFLYACSACGYCNKNVVVPKFGAMYLKSPYDGYIYPDQDMVNPYEGIQERTFTGNPFIIEGE